MLKMLRPIQESRVHNEFSCIVRFNIEDNSRWTLHATWVAEVQLAMLFVL